MLFLNCRCLCWLCRPSLSTAYPNLSLFWRKARRRSAISSLPAVAVTLVVAIFSTLRCRRIAAGSPLSSLPLPLPPPPPPPTPPRPACSSRPSSNSERATSCDSRRSRRATTCSVLCINVSIAGSSSSLSDCCASCRRVCGVSSKCCRHCQSLGICLRGEREGGRGTGFYARASRTAHSSSVESRQCRYREWKWRNPREPATIAERSPTPPARPATKWSS